jgi:hypothetical protein
LPLYPSSMPPEAPPTSWCDATASAPRILPPPAEEATRPGTAHGPERCDWNGPWFAPSVLIGLGHSRSRRHFLFFAPRHNGSLGCFLNGPRTLLQTDCLHLGGCWPGFASAALVSDSRSLTIVFCPHTNNTATCQAHGDPPALCSKPRGLRYRLPRYRFATMIAHVHRYVRNKDCYTAHSQRLLGQVSIHTRTWGDTEGDIINLNRTHFCAFDLIEAR